MTYEQPSMDDTRIDVAALLSAIVGKLPRILLITLGLLVATFVVLMFQPRMYESSSAILVEPRSSPYVRASNEQAPSSSGNEVGVVSSQIELLKSRDTLLGVIDALDLRSVAEFNGAASGFSPLAMIMQVVGRRAVTPNSIDETVLTALYDRLDVVQERDSRIISVTVSTTDPELSARIANAVALAHVARRAQLSISDTADASGWLRAEIDRLRVSVQEAESAVANFRVENDLFTGQNNTSLLDQQLSNISSQITAAQERKNTAASRAALIRGLIERGQPIEGVADVRDSVVIQRLSEEKARLQGERAQRSATMLSNHPSIRALNAQIAELDSQLRIEGARVADALEAEAQIEADLAASLEADLARAKSSASLATRETVTLDGLEREAKAQRDLLEAYLLRFNEASSRVDTNSALPDVRVVSEAAPSVTPASPKTSFIMLAVGVVSVIVQVGSVAFGELMSGRALAPVVRRPVATDTLEESPFNADELEPEQRWDDEVEASVGDATGHAGTTEDHQLVEVELADAVAELDEMDEPALTAGVAAPLEGARNPGLAGMPGLAAEAQPSIPTPQREEIAPDPAPFESRDNEPQLPPVLRKDRTSAGPVAEPGITHKGTATSEIIRSADLVSDLVLGRTHLLLLADHFSGQASRMLAENLVGDAISRGLSVALIDAGTGQRTAETGISDLSNGHAGFGDVVQKSADNGFAEVTWGTGTGVNHRSSRPATLVEALGDIYEVVIVLTGRVGGASTLDMFVELGGRVVLVADSEAELDSAESARRVLEDAGLAQVEIAALAEPVAA
ncbi:MAG: GumC family protein [Devosia marina]|uniref:GumC family protein n=1 Tax=Devosia marina TaxID=2683198 RepID=UPI000D5C438D